MPTRRVPLSAPARQAGALAPAAGTVRVKKEEDNHDHDQASSRGGSRSNKKPRVDTSTPHRHHQGNDDVQAQLMRLQDEMDILKTQHEEELKGANKRLREALLKYDAEKRERSKAIKLLAKVGRETGLFENGERLRVSEAVERLFQGLKEARERVQELEKGAATRGELVNAARGQEEGGGGGSNLRGGGVMSQDLYDGFHDYLVRTRNWARGRR